MDSLGLELNEKTQIFPIRNGIDFLGFHTYLTESGKVIRKLRHSSKSCNPGRRGMPTPHMATLGPCASRCGTVCKIF